MDDYGFDRVEVRPELGAGPLGCADCARTLLMFEVLAGPGVLAAPGACPACGTLTSDVAALVDVPAAVDLPPPGGPARPTGRHRRT
ncbi:hypothetical protein ACIRST_40565 [Kitasatospora sp. NPDC101447]|uniref:hypothetical protein n=1 Tax=Kitasatospora sp. NPDC101447 TaxID=3364102 RepID=UPI0038266A6A